jgi:hypothetical protein
VSLLETSSASNAALTTILAAKMSLRRVGDGVGASADDTIRLWTLRASL